MTELYTTSEVASILRVDGGTVRRWIKSGILESVRLPGFRNNAYRIKQSTIRRMLAPQQSQP